MMEVNLRVRGSGVRHLTRCCAKTGCNRGRNQGFACDSTDFIVAPLTHSDQLFITQSTCEKRLFFLFHALPQHFTAKDIRDNKILIYNT